jgi:hypothetical protein
VPESPALIGVLVDSGRSAAIQLPAASDPAHDQVRVTPLLPSHDS